MSKNSKYTQEELLIKLKEYENISRQMNKDAQAGYSDLAEDDEDEDEPVYVNEGQREYIAIEDDEE